MSGLHRFPFYYQRFLDSTDGWSPEERWHYLRLLIVQFRDGAVDESRLERYSPGVSTHWPAIAAKFERDAEGLLRNPFMAEVRRHVEGERQRSRDRRPTATGVVGSGQTAGQTAVNPPVKVRSNPRSKSGQTPGQSLESKSHRYKTPPTPPTASEAATQRPGADPSVGEEGGETLSPRQKHALAIVDRMVPRARRAACKSAVLSWPDAEVWDRIEKLRKQAERMAAPGPGLAFLLTGETTAEAKASSGAAP